VITLESRFIDGKLQAKLIGKMEKKCQLTLAFLKSM
jgi:hypothetical protein